MRHSPSAASYRTFCTRLSTRLVSSRAAIRAISPKEAQVATLAHRSLSSLPYSQLPPLKCIPAIVLESSSHLPSHSPDSLSRLPPARAHSPPLLLALPLPCSSRSWQRRRHNLRRSGARAASARHGRDPFTFQAAARGTAQMLPNSGGSGDANDEIKLT